MASTSSSPRPDSPGSLNPVFLSPYYSAPEPREFEVAWICPLPTEAYAARAAFDEEYKYYSEDYKRDHGFDRMMDNNIYYFGKIHDYKVVLCQLQDVRAGQINAFAAWKNLANKFESVKYLFLVGIAGGIPQPDDDPDIRLGDVVIGLPSKPHPGVMQVETGWQTGNGIPEQTNPLNNPHDHLQCWARQVIADHKNTESPRRHLFGEAARLIRANISEHVPLESGLSWDYPGKECDVCFDAAHSCQSLTRGRKPQDWCPAKCGELPKVDRSDIRLEGAQTIHGGLICSISSVIKDASHRDNLAAIIYEERQCSRILCFEMEGYGIAEKTQCLQVRGISDYSDSHKTKRWQPYAAIQAVAAAKLILASLRDSSKIVPRTTAVNPYRTRDQLEIQEFAESSLYRSLTTPSEKIGRSVTGSKVFTHERRNSNLEGSRARDCQPKELIKQEIQPLGLEIPKYYLLDETVTVPTFDKDHRCEFKIYILTPNSNETKIKTVERKYGTFEASWAIEPVSIASDFRSKLLTFKIDPNGEILQFWLPTDGIKLVEELPEYVFEWSDCESFIRAISQGKERPYFCYNAARPNLALRIAFNNIASLADTFTKLILCTYLEDSGWWQRPGDTIMDIDKRELNVFFEKSLEESRAHPSQAVVVQHHDTSVTSFVKLYRIQESFKLSAILHDNTILFIISGIQVLDFHTGPFFDDARGRHQIRPKNGRPSEQVWSTYEDKRVPYQIPTVEKPAIKLKPEYLAGYLALVMFWSANQYIARVFIKFSGIRSRKEEVVFYCGIHESHNRSAVHIFCYRFKGEKWFLLEVDRKKPPILCKDHSIIVFIKRSVSTDKIRLDPFNSVKEVEMSVKITLFNQNDYLAIRNIIKEHCANDSSNSTISSPSQS